MRPHTTCCVTQKGNVTAAAVAAEIGLGEQRVEFPEGADPVTLHGRVRSLPGLLAAHHRTASVHKTHTFTLPAYHVSCMSPLLILGLCAQLFTLLYCSACQLCM